MESCGAGKVFIVISTEAEKSSITCLLKARLRGLAYKAIHRVRSLRSLLGMTKYGECVILSETKDPLKRIGRELDP